MSKRIYTEQQREVKRKRAKEWYYNNKARGRKTRQEYYIMNRQELLTKLKEYTRKHPHMNKENVNTWREKNPDKDPRKYRVAAPLRITCIELWGNICPICGREFEKTGYLKRIFHHVQYEPVEHIVIVCYQCHNLIHSRRCYGHPFVKLAREESPECLAIAILSLHNKYLVIHRVLPRVIGRKTKQAQVYLHGENKDRAIELKEK